MNFKLERQETVLFLIDHMTTALVLVDQNCEIQFMNQSAEAVIGASAERMLGENILDRLNIERKDRLALAEATQNSRPFTVRQVEFRNLQGKCCVVDYTLSPMVYKDRMYVMVELVEIDRLIRINREESQSAVHDTTRQLARGFAHEVKNPLGGIRGAAQLLELELDDPELKEYTKVITDEADRLRNLVDRMLGPEHPPQFKPVNIHQILERVVKLVEVEAAGRVELVKDYDPSLPDFFLDREQMIQAVLNIALNGLQALLESDTPYPQLCIRTRIQHGFSQGTRFTPLACRVDIHDNGPGIPKKLQDDIFYPMITGRSEGTGLGLPITQSIITAHQGMIEFESEPGSTCFSIYLPIMKAGASQK